MRQLINIWCIDLSEPIDVFSEWIDAIESQDKKKTDLKPEISEKPRDANASSASKKPVKKTLAGKKKTTKHAEDSETEESEAEFSD